MKKLPLALVLRKAVGEIEQKLGIEVYGIERMRKVYHINSNSFRLRVIDENNNKSGLFLKFLPNGPNCLREKEGAKLIGQYVNTPQVVLSHCKRFQTSWLLFRFVEGKLMTEKALLVEREMANQKSFLKLEYKKEESLLKMYQKTQRTISIRQYFSLPANSLFYRRICGRRRKVFLGSWGKGEPTRLSDLLRSKVSVNGKKSRLTGEEIFSSISKKYFRIKKGKRIWATLGHGDSHHGNIIIGKDENIFLIDNEYAGYNPPLMELAKPYYNDFLGSLFFHHHNLLQKYFELIRVRMDKRNLHIRIQVKRKMNFRLELTRIKLEMRRNLLKKNTANNEMLTLNDYLIMCHTLTRDPNLYPLPIKYLFIAFIFILADFNPFRPASIYPYFENY